MKCDAEQLAAYALGILDEAQARAVEGHTHSCESCARELARLGEMAMLLKTLPEPESEPMDVEELWSKVASRTTAARRFAGLREWFAPKRRWAVALAATACLAVLSFHYGVTVQVGQVRVAIGGVKGAGPVAPEMSAADEQLVRHLARHDEAALRVERTLVGLALAVKDLDAWSRQQFVSLRNEVAAQRALDQTAIKKSFSLVASEMTDAFQKRQ